MEGHDIDYYEARVKDTKLEDITSSQSNADILASLRDNDPEFNHFYIVADHEDDEDFVVRAGDHLGWLGYFVGKSEHLEGLYIDNCPENINLNAFFVGVGRNRSIETLRVCIDLGESFQSLIPFLKNNDSLHELIFNNFDIGLQCARDIAMLLGQQSSLKRLDFEETNLDNEGLKQIAIGLRSQPQIEEMSLKYPSDLLANILGNNVNGDEGLLALVAELKHCHNLTSLELLGRHMFTEEGIRSLSTLFRSDNCRLEHLDLAQMNIDDDGMAVLATGLAFQPSLKRLDLWGMSISDRGLQDLVRGLVNCNLEKLSLDLSSNMLMDSVSGMRCLGSLVGRTASMRSLCLRESLTDIGLHYLVEGIMQQCSLTELYLSHNHLITANGLASLSSLLRDEHCSLCILYLYGINFGNDGAAVLAGGLIGNKSLTELRFNPTDSGITGRGWATFSRLLCDTSSVNSTYISNHTLQHIGDYGSTNTPSDILLYSRLNKLQNQAAAICKILHNHPDIDVKPLFQFNLGCLPLLVEWFEVANSYIDKVNESSEAFQSRELSAVYQFIRGMPLLAANGYRRQKKKVELKSKSKKRKLDQTR